jgi:hypothetical protein
MELPPMTMPDTGERGERGLQTIGVTRSGHTVYARLTHDHPHGRGWEVYVDVDGRPEKVASAGADRRLGATDAVHPSVNWSAWGSQRPSVAADVADALNFAARLAVRTREQMEG